MLRDFTTTLHMRHNVETSTFYILVLRQRYRAALCWKVHGDRKILAKDKIYFSRVCLKCMFITCIMIDYYIIVLLCLLIFFFFFFNISSPPKFYPLSQHDAFPI